MKTKLILLTMAIGASTCLLLAQETPRPAGAPGAPGGQGGQGGQGGAGGRPGGPGGRMIVMPLVEALDLNKDGTIDADEIAKATESLKRLDKNSDGKITPEEYRPQRPPGAPGGPGGAGGRGGQPGAGEPPAPRPQPQP